MTRIKSTEIERLFASAKLSPTERKVLVFLINNAQELEGMGLKSVAKSCFTSSTTVIRLAQKLGYHGYRELSYELSTLADNQQGSSAPELSALGCKCTQQDIDIFNMALSKSGVACLYGEGWSHIIAEYIEKKMIIHGHQTILHDFLGTNTLLEQMPDLSMAILISKSGFTTAVNEAARRCKRVGIPIVSILGNKRSRLAQYSDAVFLVTDDHPFESENRSRNYFFARCIMVFEELLYQNLESTGGGSALAPGEAISSRPAT